MDRYKLPAASKSISPPTWQQTPRLVTSPEELEALEREIRQRTDRLGSLLVGSHLQQALDAAALQAEQERLVRQWPKPLKNDGKVKVRVRTAQGLAVVALLSRRGVLLYNIGYTSGRLTQH